MNKLPYCPICDRLILCPVWLPEQFTAWCHVCERGYTDAELIWKPERNDEVERKAIADAMSISDQAQEAEA